jgi:hypothetical protein
MLGNRFDNASGQPLSAEFFADCPSAGTGELGVELSDKFPPLALFLNQLRKFFLRVLWLLVAHFGFRLDSLALVLSLVTAPRGGGAGGVPTKTNELPYFASASSLVRVRKVTLPLFGIFAMAVFHAGAWWAAR